MLFGTGILIRVLSTLTLLLKNLEEEQYYSLKVNIRDNIVVNC